MFLACLVLKRFSYHKHKDALVHLTELWATHHTENH